MHKDASRGQQSIEYFDDVYDMNILEISIFESNDEMGSRNSDFKVKSKDSTDELVELNPLT